MSAIRAAVERSARRVEPVGRPRGPQLLTLLFTILQPATFALLGTLKEKPMKAAYRRYPYAPCLTKYPPPVPTPPPRQLDNIFIDALVQACLCREHATRTPPRQGLFFPSTHLYHKARRRYIYEAGKQKRHLHRNAAPVRAPTPRTPLSREEYISMVDFYREPFSTRAVFPDDDTQLPPPMLPGPIDAVRRVLQSQEKPELCFTGPPPPPPSEPDDRPCNQMSPGAEKEGKVPRLQGNTEPAIAGLCPEPAVPPDSQSLHPYHPALDNLLEVIKNRECMHDEAFKAYSALPNPGVSYLSEESRNLLFICLSRIQKKTRDSMLRYLSVADDMKACSYPLNESQWTSAISFCGQCFTRLKSTDVALALRTWKEMEQEAGILSGPVTFNVLFDIAAKAGKFVLAEMIQKEMENRNLSMNRYFRTSYIYYHGLRGDGNSVRRAYRDFVEAGEVVDTIVLNCVIASLIRAGEPSAATQVYQRMKLKAAKHINNNDNNNNNSSHPIPTPTWREKRDLGRLLDRLGRQFKHHPTQLRRLRDDQPLTPDLHTYHIFVEYHVTKTGELHRIATLLNEMQDLGIPMHGRIFLKLFTGFAYHGGIRYTPWTVSRLESVWKSFLCVLDQENEVEITKWMVTWIVRAFERCAGRERMLEVWEELMKRWKAPEGEVDIVIDALRHVLKGDVWR